MDGEIRIKAPAKINIGLNIIGKREDSFHNLETVFYPVKIFDEIRISESEKFEFKTNNEALDSESDNLIVKAKNLLERESGKKITAEIYLEKNIPVGAGLGGGSSDAAAVLKNFNEILSLKIDDTKLAGLALQLGSDVPFFLNPVPSFAESRGEILKTINLKISEHILIVNPGIHISTAWAFSKIKPAKPLFSLEYIVENFEYADWREKVVNDFEGPVYSEYPEIKRIKEDLYNLGASFALMTGSGSTLFSIFKDSERAAYADKFFKEKKYFTHLES